jgi:hypothetical protein
MNIWVGHRSFATAATMSSFSFFDPSKPQVSSLQMAGASPLASATLRAGSAAAKAARWEFAVTLGSVSAAARCTGSKILLSGNSSASILSCIVDGRIGIARHSFEIPAAAQANATSMEGSGDTLQLHGLVLLGSTSQIVASAVNSSSCEADCCGDGNCRERCGGGVKWACFTIELFDDSVPTIVGSTGSFAG